MGLKDGPGPLNPKSKGRYGTATALGLHSQRCSAAASHPHAVTNAAGREGRTADRGLRQCVLREGQRNGQVRGWRRAGPTGAGCWRPQRWLGSSGRQARALMCQSVAGAARRQVRALMHQARGFKP